MSLKAIGVWDYWSMIILLRTQEPAVGADCAFGEGVQLSAAGAWLRDSGGGLSDSAWSCDLPQKPSMVIRHPGRTPDERHKGLDEATPPCESVYATRANPGW